MWRWHLYRGPAHFVIHQNTHTHTHTFTSLGKNLSWWWCFQQGEQHSLNCSFILTSWTFVFTSGMKSGRFVLWASSWRPRCPASPQFLAQQLTGSVGIARMPCYSCPSAATLRVQHTGLGWIGVEGRQQHMTDLGEEQARHNVVLLCWWSAGLVTSPCEQFGAFFFSWEESEIYQMSNAFVQFNHWNQEKKSTFYLDIKHDPEAWNQMDKIGDLQSVLLCFYGVSLTLLAWWTCFLWADSCKNSPACRTFVCLVLFSRTVTHVSNQGCDWWRCGIQPGA